MADQPTDPTSAATPQPGHPEQPTARPRKKKRSWLKILGVLVLLLVLLIVFLPGIASTGPVKSFAVGKINDNLNGTVEIDDWSIGWTSGIDVEGIKVLDQQGVTVLTVSRVRVPISLIDAARGHYALGDVLIERPDLVKFVINEDGTTNYEQLVKSDPNPPKTPKEPSGASAIPDISGKIAITELRGSIFRGEGPAVMVIQPSDVVVDIPDINGTIGYDVRLAFGPVGTQPGTLTLLGTIDAIEDHEVIDDKFSADQKLGLAKVDFATLAPLLKMAGLDANLAGVADGAITLKIAPVGDVSASGEIKVADFAFGGPMLNGDTFKTSVLRVPVQVASANQGGVTRVTANDTGIYFDQGSVIARADAPLSAIQNAVAQKPPGGVGTLGVDVKIPGLAELANQMPNTLQLAQGVQLTAGNLSEALSVTMTNDAATISSTLNLRDVRGTKDGQPLRPLDPIHLTASATHFGGQDLRDLGLKLVSGFATAEGGGASLANLKLTSDVDLEKLREQAGQFTDALDPLQSGTAAIALTTSGDPTKENARVDATLNVEVRDLTVTEPTTRPAHQPMAMLREPWMRLNVTGGVQRGTNNVVDGVKDLVLTLQTNDPQKPTVDLETTADLVMKTRGDASIVTAPAFRVSKLNIDLPAARKELGVFLSALDDQGLEPTAGRVTLANPMIGSYDGTSLVITADAPLALVASNVTLRQTDVATRVQTTPIDDRTVRVNVAGTFDLGETFAANLSQFSAVEDRKLFNVAKEDGDLIVRMLPGGTVQGSGALVATADLVAMNRVVAAFGSPLIERQPDGSMDLQSGELGRRIKLAATEKQTEIDAAIDINGLTLTTAAEPIANETIQTVVKLTSPADGNVMSGSVHVVSSFAKAAVEDLQLLLRQQGSTASPAVWERVRNAEVNASVENLSKAFTLYSALTPATQPSEPETPSNARVEGVPADEPEPPLTITEGSANIAMRVAREGRQTNLNVSEIRISNLSLAKGLGSFRSPRDMVISLSASLDAADAIERVTVTKLNGDLAVATAALTEPLVVDDLNANATAKGALKVEGRIEDISRLLEALAGQAPGTGYPYAGQLAMTQRVTSAGGPIQLTGKATATDFVAFQAGTRVPAFAEKQLDLTQDVTLDTTNERAVIKTLALDMPSSGALKLNVTGGVSDWATARRLDDDTRVDLAYDLAKLWPVVKPLISEAPEDYDDLVIAGQAKRSFTLRGSYPATGSDGRPLAFHESIRSLLATGGLTVQKFSYEGVDITDLDLPLYLIEGGKLVTVYADRPREKRHPAPAKLNGGTIDLGGFTIDLGQEQPRLSIPKKQRLLGGVSMNPLFADNILGKFLNPSFVDPEQARGLIDLTIGEVTNVPLGDLITGKNEGRAHLILSIREVNIGNKFINDLLAKLSVDTRDGAILANIRDADVRIEDGILAQDLDFMLEKFTLAFDGRVRLSDQVMLPLNLSIPTAQLRSLDDDLRKYVPAAITIPITGTTAEPKWNLDVAVRTLAVEAGKKALLGGLLDRAADRPSTPSAGEATTRPAEPATPEDNLRGALQDLLGGRTRDEKKRAPAEREPSGSDRISQPKP